MDVYFIVECTCIGAGTLRSTTRKSRGMSVGPESRRGRSSQSRGRQRSRNMGMKYAGHLTLKPALLGILWEEQLKVGIPTVPVLVRQWHSMFEIVLTKPQFVHVETKKRFWPRSLTKSYLCLLLPNLGRWFASATAPCNTFAYTFNDGTATKELPVHTWNFQSLQKRRGFKKTVA